MGDDQRIMSRSATALLILLIAALPVGFSTTGCNPDTRELLLDPRLPVAEPYAGGTWTKTPVLTCGRSVDALAAWSRDDVLMVGYDGLAVRVQGGVARNVDAPTTARLVAAAAQPDGPAWVSASDGSIYRLDGETWTIERRTSVRAQALWRFPDGSLLGAGNAGYVLRRTPDGVWEDFNTGAGVSLTALWARNRDDCWALGGAGVVAHFDGTTWSVERPFGDDVWSLSRIAGDADGRVAIVDGSLIHLREDGVWRDLPELPNSDWASDASFLGGQLLAWYSRGWYRWDGVAWVEEGELGTAPFRHIVQGDDLLLLDSNGGLLRLADGDVETLLPSLGGIADFEATPDGVVILTDMNWILRETATEWRVESKLSQYGSYSSVGRRLLRSAAGYLVVLANGVLYREAEGGWEPLAPSLGSSVTAIFPLEDGTLLLPSGSRLWAWRDGLCAFLCEAPTAWSSLLSVAGESPAQARYLFEECLARYDGATMQTVADRPSIEVALLARDPVEGLLLAGRGGLFAGEGAGTLDITPRCEVGVRPERALIGDFAVTPAGDWLAWIDDGYLLRRRAGLWQRLDGTNGSPLGNRWPVAAGRSIRVVGGGDIWLASYSHLFRFRDTAP